MLPPDIPLANFTISVEGKRGIALLREAFDAKSTDKAAVTSIGWARVMPNDKAPFETVGVSFYGASQVVPEMRAAIQVVSGVEVLFFADRFDLPKFAGKVLDFSEDRGFFLR